LLIAEMPLEGVQLPDGVCFRRRVAGVVALRAVRAGSKVLLPGDYIQLQK
jgi:hypothetical protein